uniref:ATP synthase F0 subunit 8 n=1 Tax=Pisione sp. YZ-2018 TaxID=2153337 RepID=A0A343W6I3_9ANNE|nr:ATP synthase F0 subunit 8 [Pisione sp. YZ-2018]
MPHLSPFNWIFAPIMFWALLLTFSSFLWWNQTPLFPASQSPFSYPSNIFWLW